MHSNDIVAIQEVPGRFSFAVLLQNGSFESSVHHFQKQTNAQLYSLGSVGQIQTKHLAVAGIEINVDVKINDLLEVCLQYICSLCLLHD